MTRAILSIHGTRILDCLVAVYLAIVLGALTGCCGLPPGYGQNFCVVDVLPECLMGQHGLTQEDGQ